MKSVLAVMVALALASVAHAQCGPQTVGLGNINCANGQCGRSLTRSSVAPRQTLAATNQRSRSFARSSSGTGARQRLTLNMAQPQSFAHEQYSEAPSGAYAESSAGTMGHEPAAPLVLPQVALPSDALAQSSASSGCGGGGCGGGRAGLLQRMAGGRRGVSRSVSRSFSRN